MPRTAILPASAPHATALSGTILGKLSDVFNQIWRLHIHRSGLRAMLHLNPRLLADAGMAVEDAECEAGTRFWSSPHVPPLRHF